MAAAIAGRRARRRDSVRGTLRRGSGERLGFGIVSAMDLQDRFATATPAPCRRSFQLLGSVPFRPAIFSRYNNTPVVNWCCRQPPPVGMVQKSRANRVRLHGVARHSSAALPAGSDPMHPAETASGSADLWPAGRRLPWYFRSARACPARRCCPRRTIDLRRVARQGGPDPHPHPGGRQRYGLLSGAGSPLNAFVARYTGPQPPGGTGA